MKLVAYFDESLDDVDFTVLAATSVLGDLIEKCPPAEACRDAFERMSRATVRMCMSTTGFGSQAFGLQSQHASQPVSRESQQYPYQNQQQQYNQSNSRRQPPEFDMNFRDLFPQGTNINRSTEQYTKPIEFSHPFSSNVETANSQAPENAQSQQLFQMDNTALPDAPQMPPSINQQTSFETAGLYQQPIDLRTIDQYQGGMDFLDSTDMEGNGGGIGASTVDLGFGLGSFDLDGEHDWSENGGFDLFDGFFFGGPGAGATAGL